MRPVRSRKRILITISSIIVVVILFHILGWLTGVEHALRRLISPVSAGIYNISVNLGDDKTADFDSADELADAYRNLHDDYVKAKVDEATLALLEEENAQLRASLGFLSTSSYQYVGAEVIGKNIEPLSRTVILNQGSNIGIQEGNAVIVQDGVLIGTVMRANKRSSVVRLINDNQSTIAATIINLDRSVGLIEGGFGLSVNMNFIPQNEIITIGDTVVTSGLNDDIPSGLVIGVVDAIEKEAYQPFQEAVVRPPVELDKIRIVSVITNTQYGQETDTTP